MLRGILKKEEEEEKKTIHSNTECKFVGFFSLSLVWIWDFSIVRLTSKYICAFRRCSYITDQNAHSSPPLSVCLCVCLSDRRAHQRKISTCGITCSHRWWQIYITLTNLLHMVNKILFNWIEAFINSLQLNFNYTTLRWYVYMCRNGDRIPVLFF